MEGNGTTINAGVSFGSKLVPITPYSVTAGAGVTENHELFDVYSFIGEVGAKINTAIDVAAAGDVVVWELMKNQIRGIFHNSIGNSYKLE